MKRLIVIVFIVFGSFLTLCLYRTYAYNTTVVEDTPTTTDLEYTFKIGNSSIKEITISSGETKYYDVVMGNPNNAKISYSIYYEMVSPNTKPDGFSIEYTSKSTGDSTGKVDKNGNITLNLVVSNTSSNAVTVKLGSLAGYVKGGELVLSSGQVVIPKLTASKFIMSLDDGSTGDSGNGVYKVEHDAIPASSSATGSEIPAVTDYRYYGASPNNYICLDNSGGTCEDRHLYRIIGSIYEELSGQNLLKVIKATPLTDGKHSTFNFDCTSSGSYSDAWSTTTSGTSSGSQLMKLLNSGAWWNGTSGIYYTYNFDETVDFTNYKLSDMSKNFIALSRYYLGIYSTSDKTTSDIYLAERGTTTRDGAKYWDGNIGLRYRSDYNYGHGLSSYIGSEWFISGDRLPTNDPVKYNNALDKLVVYPTFYLKPTTSISSGDGSSSNPYVIQ